MTTTTTTTTSDDVMDLLRFATIGSVDDGKSTLIGRLLVDTRQLFDDQMDAVAQASKDRGVGDLDLSFVTDGLRAEREQGITIDVAYRYAATPKRKFVIADCPGHVQYTANMATGASTADLALVVVDATTGLKEQTRRHLCIASLLGVRQLIVCANKMDEGNWRFPLYERVVAQMSALAKTLEIESLTVIPISALHGDNVVDRSNAAPYYEGPTVLEALESAPAGGWAGVHGDKTDEATRLPVQWILRQPGGGRTYAGMVDGAPIRVGEQVTVLPAGLSSTVTEVRTPSGPADAAAGDMIVGSANLPTVTNEIEATICWFGTGSLTPGSRFRVKHTTRTTPGIVDTIASKLDVNDLSLSEASELVSNEIGVVRLKTADPLVVDSYGVNRITGSFVLVDEVTNITVAAGMVGIPTLLHQD